MMMSFDRVADIYDETRRMPPEVAERILERIADVVDSSGGVVLEMGIEKVSDNLVVRINSNLQGATDTA